MTKQEFIALAKELLEEENLDNRSQDLQLLRREFKYIANRDEENYLDQEETNKVIAVYNELVKKEPKLLVSPYDEKKAIIEKARKLLDKKEIIAANRELDRLSDEVDRSIKSLGNMHEDEKRARDELQNMNELLVKCRSRVRNYRLPIIHEDFFIEVSEAEEALEALKLELESKPIIIKTLNMRVETAHDLIFKLNIRTNDLIKYAYFTELMVIYSNKFKKEFNLSDDLSKVEYLYSQGEYKESYDLCLKIMDTITPNSSKKINKICNN